MSTPPFPLPFDPSHETHMCVSPCQRYEDPARCGPPVGVHRTRRLPHVAYQCRHGGSNRALRLARASLSGPTEVELAELRNCAEALQHGIGIAIQGYVPEAHKPLQARQIQLIVALEKW